MAINADDSSERPVGAPSIEASSVLAASGSVDSERQIREFAEAKAFLDNILESSTKYPIIGMDPDHRILSWNNGASCNYGYAAQEVVGKDSLGHPVGFLVMSHDISEKQLAEEQLRSSAAYSRSLIEAGRMLGAFAAARDVTAQRQAEREVAKQRARELERLAELERFQKLIVGRELRMIELKKEIEDLRAAAGGQ